MRIFSQSVHLVMLLSGVCLGGCETSLGMGSDAARPDSSTLDSNVSDGGGRDILGAPDVASTDTGAHRDSTPPMDAGCTPSTCASSQCGEQPNGCGATMDCGECAATFDCGNISRHSQFTVCGETDSTCSGLFNDGSSCDVFCASAGLECAGSTNGHASCVDEGGAELGCTNAAGHLEDWCECVVGAGGVGTIVDPGGVVDPECGGSGTTVRLGWRSGSYTNRASWVLSEMGGCRDYAYTARFTDEMRRRCDPMHVAGSASGVATFNFSGVAPGRYDVVIRGFHTENRNPSGALFTVDTGGTRHSGRVDQRDSSNPGFAEATMGTYCLEGDVVVRLDSSSNASDSVNRISLVAR